MQIGERASVLRDDDLRVGKLARVDQLLERVPKFLAGRRDGACVRRGSRARGGEPQREQRETERQYGLSPAMVTRKPERTSG